MPRRKFLLSHQKSYIYIYIYVERERERNNYFYSKNGENKGGIIALCWELGPLNLKMWTIN